MPDYNSEGYINELFSDWPDADEEVDRSNIMSGMVILTGNMFEDKLKIQITRNESQTLSEDPSVSSSGYSHGYETGPSGQSQATPEDGFEEDYEEDFEEAVMNAAREIAHKYPNEHLFGDPDNNNYSSQRLRITIRDDFEGKILHFFQSRDEETACWKPGHMTKDTKLHLLAVIQVYQSWIRRHTEYITCDRTVTPAQGHFIETLRGMIIYGDSL